MNYNQEDVAQKISLTDEAVSVIRSENVNSQLGVSGNTTLSIFKPGPLLISLSISSTDRLSTQTVLNKSSDYLVSHYPAIIMGQDIFSIRKHNLLLGVGGGLTVGFLLGILISLIRGYFKNF